jgi:hypothetical protein
MAVTYSYCWRPLGDLNPCYRRERTTNETTLVHTCPATTLISLKTGHYCLCLPKAVQPHILAKYWADGMRWLERYVMPISTPAQLGRD